MNKRLFVTRLPWSVDDQSLRDLFLPYGVLTYAKIIVDRDTNRSKGFGFVEFESAEDAQNAIAGMNDTEVEGRKIVVKIAQPQERKPYQR